MTILNDSNVERKLLRLFSLSIWRCECENCKCLICAPFVKNKSWDKDVTVRSKSYTESDCIGDDISWSIDRNDTAVVPGHSKNNPERRKIDFMLKKSEFLLYKKI